MKERKYYIGESVMGEHDFEMAAFPLCIFTSTSMNAEIYRLEVLDPLVKVFRGAIGNSFLQMNDNGRLHHAALVIDYL